MELTHHVRHPVDGWLTDPVEEEPGRYHHGEFDCSIGLEIFYEITPEQYATEQAQITANAKGTALT